MKSIIKVVAVAAVVVAPVLSFAQSDTNSAVTRSQVKQDLQQVEAAGYNPRQATARRIRRMYRPPKARRAPEWCSVGQR